MRQKRDMMADQGDWYSDLFAEERPASNAPQDTRHGEEEPEQREEKRDKAEKREARQPPEEEVETSPAPPRPARAPSSRSPLRRKTGWAALTWLGLAVSLLTATVLFLFRGADRLSFTLVPSAGTAGPVSGLLSEEYRYLVRKDVYRLLQLKKGRLLEMERAISRLESERAAFESGMEKREALYEENRSIFGLTGDERDMQSIAGLVRKDVEFSGEIRRRSREYDEAYRREMAALRRAETRLEEEIDTLTAQNRGLAAAAGNTPVEVPGFHEAVLTGTRRAHVERMLNAVRNGDYAGAVDALDSLGEVTGGPERDAVTLLRESLSVIRDYDRRLEGLDAAAPLDSITRSFLAEEYGSLVDGTSGADDPYLEPLLTGLRGALFRNAGQTGDIEEELAKRRDQRKRVARARSLEEEGAFEEALAVYEELLREDMDPYDREYLVDKVHSLWLPLEAQRIKREQNTRAIKYLQSGRLLSREGRDEEALNFYRMLIEECPNSDYVEEAMENIVSIAGYAPSP
jgi:tetratricopeptide (TPR) repeat protein